LCREAEYVEGDISALDQNIYTNVVRRCNTGKTRGKNCMMVYFLHLFVSWA